MKSRALLVLALAAALAPANYGPDYKPLAPIPGAESKRKTGVAAARRAAKRNRRKK